MLVIAVALRFFRHITLELHEIFIKCGVKAYNAIQVAYERSFNMADGSII